MAYLLHELVLKTAERQTAATALQMKAGTLSYAQLAQDMGTFARHLADVGLAANDRVAVYLPKCFEAVVGMFGTAQAGGIFVPINPVLKPPQIEHILNDCNVSVLITSSNRATQLREVFARTPSLRHLVIVDEATGNVSDLPVTSYADATDRRNPELIRDRIDNDIVSILYTSGSTGKPKGVVLSHRNMVTGATSVAQYLGNNRDDRILAVLPFSFDAGFSQLTTAFSSGATVVMLEYLLPQDVVNTVAKQEITALTGVPPLWIQLSQKSWPETVPEHLRYIANTGGAMPQETLASLREKLPNVDVYLMYGLTEAFRSTYLPPAEIDRKPGSMGKAIPNAEIMVARPDGTECDDGEHGELVHRGALVAQGYWNDTEKTAARFKPAPGSLEGVPITELTVWSGDTVYRDDEGFLFFVGRLDEMIKTSGYRVSPVEIEEALYSSGLIAEVVAMGVPHPALGQAIVVAAVAMETADESSEDVLQACRKALPQFMVPHHVQWYDRLPRNPNGKLDRSGLRSTVEQRLKAEG